MNLQIATEFTQATTSSQPNAFANSVIFDGNNDNQKKVINDIYIGDSVGIIYFSGYFDDSASNYFIASSDNTIDTKFIAFGILSTGEIYVQTYSGTQNVIKSTNKITNGDYFQASIEGVGGGNPYVLKLNKVIETPIIVAGVNTSIWFNAISNRNVITLSSISRPSAINSPSRIERISYLNVTQTAAEKAEWDSYYSYRGSSNMIASLISNSTNWAEFAINWTQVHGGTGTSVITANKLVLSGGSGTFNDLIYYNKYITNLEHLDITLDYVMDNYGAGISLGISPSNSSLSNATQCFFQHSNSTSFGFMRQYRAGSFKRNKHITTI